MKHTLTAIALTMTLAPAAQADVRINGFANFVGGVTSSNDSVYGYNEDVSFREGSLMAIQVSSDVNDKLTATGQIVAKGKNDFEADFEWAYLSYQATDNLSILGGRFRIPFFRYSSSFDVGYSYHWVLAPQSVYGIHFNNMDGLRFDYNDYIGDWEYGLQVAYGSFDTRIFDAEATGRNVFSLTGEAAYEWFKVRAVYGQTKNTIDLSTSNEAPVRALSSAMNNLIQLGLSDLENDMQIRDDKAVFTGLGIEIDRYDWFVSGEITKIEVENSYLADDDAFYVTAGFRTGKFTPSITFERFKSDVKLKFMDKVKAAPAAVQPYALPIVVGVQQSQQEDYKVVTLGVRYDWSTSIALKADISKRTYGDNDVNVKPDQGGVGLNNDATLFRVAAHYVF